MPSHPHFLWVDLFQKGKNDPLHLFHHLQNNVLFKNLTPRELTYLSGIVHERVYQAGEAVFHQNDKGLGVYLITQGRIAIRSRSTAAHSDILVTYLGPGSFFGEIALVEEDSLRTATAICIERSQLIGFFKPDLIEIIERYPGTGVKILYQLASVLSQRLVETTQKLSRMKEKE